MLRVASPGRNHFGSGGRPAADSRLSQAVDFCPTRGYYYRDVSMALATLQELFVHDLEDMYYAEQELLDALYHEVALELAGEQVLLHWQLRRPDFLEEWAVDAPEYRPGGGEADFAFSLPKSLRLPIPQREIDTNNALDGGSQNPGYN
jgi:hypothetical protein